MRASGWFLGLPLLGLAAACGSGKVEPEPTPPTGYVDVPRFDQVASAAPSADAPPEGEARTLTGALRHTPVPEAMSEAAYHGVAFVLDTPEGPENLAPGAVTSDALLAMAGQTVRIDATWQAPRPPRPDENYPTDFDGKAIPRAGRWVVQALAPTP